MRPNVYSPGPTALLTGPKGGELFFEDGGFSNSGTFLRHGDDSLRDSGTYQVGATRTSSLGSLQHLETDV
ncbi:hypothetical protein BV898_12407 [Hypsibius exemplaris]|uniref:Uncharacterized protein n=1 Tax=Hypsibius exemplaris TaxID=2072580 RepID=A0A1W0WE21_HYPEX|nr:hypothetical protein BV898_12407 [Hypsibius exemplaris]